MPMTFDATLKELAVVAQKLVERLSKEATHEESKKLLTEALLLAGLRVQRDVALNVFRGVRMVQESDTYLMIVEEGEEKRAKKDILLVGELRLGAASDSIREQLNRVSDLARLDRIMRKAVEATSWHDILNTP